MPDPVPDPVTAAITLSLYIARQFVAMVIAMLFALSGLVSLFDFIELLRRSSSRPDATFGLVVEIAGLRLPYVAMQILPFAVLLGGMICFWRLTRSSELIVARASGISAWEFLTAPTLCAVLLGALATAAVSPISSAMLARAETLEDAYLRTGGGPLALNGGQLWLRQSDHDDRPRKGVAIIHALGVRLENKTLTAHDVTVFHLDDNDQLLARIDAKQAMLGRGAWTLGDARLVRPGHLPEPPHDAHAADRPDGRAGAGEFCPAGYAVGVGAARFHRAARPLGLFLHPPPAAFPGAAGAAAAAPGRWRWWPPGSRCARRAAAGSRA